MSSNKFIINDMSSLKSADHFVGVDVGTGSARAALFDGNGNIKSVSVVRIDQWSTESSFYEQSSDQIWKAVVKAIKEVISDSHVAPSVVKGLGFDATCSLVVLNHHMKPKTVSKDDVDMRNVIMWMDHRAHKEADAINATKHKILETVGGTMSLEMELPKLLWLKKNLPDTWRDAKHFFDLPDFLTWKATGSLSRSSCSLGCKWSYQTKESSWDTDFLSLIGLEDLATCQQKIGTEVKTVGSSCGEGLTPEAAEELGLIPGTAVATSIIDAYAGALGCLSSVASDDRVQTALGQSLVLIAGTSSCHIVCSNQEVPVTGVWGPYYNAMIPGMWVNEGGQSAAGSLMDFILSKHEMLPHARKQASGIHLSLDSFFKWSLYAIAASKGHRDITMLSRNLHIWPDFHGNRSPWADQTLRGMMSGLDLSTNMDGLAILYLAVIQALAYGTKSIVAAMEAAGHDIANIIVCGGLSKNELFIQTHADVLGLPIVIPKSKEPVLLGSAILGMCASGKVADIQEAMHKMGQESTIVEPKPETSSYHKKKYAVFMEMLKDQRKYRDMMGST